MEPLSLTLEDRVFRYDQVCREGMLALYRQTHKASGVQRFEVIHIQERQAHTWPNGQTTPAHEAYPGAQSWGRMGWTFFHFETAQAALASHIQVAAGATSGAYYQEETAHAAM